MWVQILALPLISMPPWATYLTSEPQFPHLGNENNGLPHVVFIIQTCKVLGTVNMLKAEAQVERTEVALLQVPRWGVGA